MSKKVVIVGSGFGGLSAAALLARRGFEVTVVERNARAGGRAMVFEKDGFRFDSGPSWYLMPDIFERFFDLFGRKPTDYYQLVRLSPSYRIFFSPDDYVDVSDDLEANVELFEREEKGAGRNLRLYLQAASYQYRVALDEFLYKDYRSIFDFLNRRTLVEGRNLHVLESMDRYARRFFESDRLRKILQYSTVFLGGSPSNTPAIYSLLAHVDFNLGVWYPVGGMGEVVRGMQSLAESLGARFLFNCEAKRILTKGGRAVAVQTDVGDLQADIVVVNADYPHAELDLLQPADRSYPERYWARRVIAPSALMLFLGIQGRLPKLLHHTLSFQHDWMAHFDAIFRKPSWPEAPSYYMCCPTRTDASVAPPDCDQLVVLVPVSAGLDDGDEIRDRFTEKTLAEIGQIAGEPMDGRIRSRTIFSHRDFKRLFNAYKGTALGLSHSLMQSAVFRPKHRSRRVRGLYYTGQYTHPGIGMPMAIISSTILTGIVADEASR